MNRLLTSLSIIAVGVAAAMPASAQRGRVSVTRDRLRLIAPDSVVRAGVPILRAGRIDTTQVTAQGSLQLDPGAFAVLRTTEAVRDVPGPLAPPADTTPRGAVGEPFRVLPMRFLTPDATGTGTWVLRPVFKVASRLRWNDETGEFRGALFVAVEDSVRRGESRPLPTPIRFQLLADADRIQPERLTFEHTNFPLERIDLVARRAVDSLRVQIVPEFDPRGVDVWVPVEPSLIIEATPSRIQGWGVGSARVIVRVIGATPSTPVSASVSATGGELDTLEVAISDGGLATTRIRSGGTGRATLTASAPGFGDGIANLEFVLPFVFFLAAMLGGVFGGLGAAAWGRKGRRKARWMEHAVKGVFAGVLAAVVWYALGINLLEIDPGMPRFNELAVFGFAAIAGFFGISLVGRTASQA